MRIALTGALEKAFDQHLKKSGDGALSSGLGLDLTASEGSRRRLEIRRVDLARATKRNSKDLAQLLFGDSSSKDGLGLVERLEAALDKAYEQLSDRLSPEEAVGLRLDVRG